MAAEPVKDPDNCSEKTLLPEILLKAAYSMSLPRAFEGALAKESCKFLQKLAGFSVGLFAVGWMVLVTNVRGLKGVLTRRRLTT